MYSIQTSNTYVEPVARHNTNQTIIIKLLANTSTPGSFEILLPIPRKLSPECMHAPPHYLPGRRLCRDR